MNSEAAKAENERHEDYLSTVHCILTFAALGVHDGQGPRTGARFGIGRRMDTSPQNAVAPGTTVTPDLVCQTTPTFGLVAEAKKSLGRDRQYWRSTVEQLRKYDDDLTGWWTGSEQISSYNAAILIHVSRSRAFKDYLSECEESESGATGPNSLIIEFSRADEAVPYFFFRTEYGTLTGDDELALKLKDGVQVPLERILESFSTVRFYDAKPPMSYLLTVLWTNSVPSRLNDVEYDAKLKAFPVPMDVSDTARDLQDGHGSGQLFRDDRSVVFPKERWVREAFERLVGYGLAIPGGDSGKYTVLFKQIRADVREHFVGLVSGDKSEHPDSAQEPVLPFGDEEE